MHECYQKQYTSDPFARSTIETGDAPVIYIKEEMGDHHNNQHDYNSRKAWNIIINLSNDPSSTSPCLASVNQLPINSRGTMSTKPKRLALPPTSEVGESIVYSFSEEGYRRCIASSKRHSLQSVELLQPLQTAVESVSKPPAPAMGAQFTVFLASQSCGHVGWLALLLIKTGDVETNRDPTTTHN